MPCYERHALIRMCALASSIPACACEHDVAHVHGVLTQMIGYDELLGALGLSGIRPLEDLLISDCFYSGVIAGKLDQRAQCLQVSQGGMRESAVSMQRARSVPSSHTCSCVNLPAGGFPDRLCKQSSCSFDNASAHLHPHLHQVRQ